MLDVRAMRSADMGSDLTLVRVNTTAKLRNRNGLKRQERRRYYNVQWLIESGKKFVEKIWWYCVCKNVIIMVFSWVGGEKM